MLENEDANLAKLVRRKVGGPRECDGLQPVLRELASPPNVDGWGSTPSLLKKKNLYGPETRTVGITRYTRGV